jgi:CBS domain-containing protein
MRVKDLMSRDVKSCGASDRLDLAARLMWDGDLGIVPVLDAEKRVVGVLTDRDIAMAAYTKGERLSALSVKDAMAKRPTSCHPEATVESALLLMAQGHVRRLPVVDESGKLVGMLSLNDLARQACRQRKAKEPNGIAPGLVDALGAICEPRPRAAGAPAKADALAKGVLIPVSR